MKKLLSVIIAGAMFFAVMTAYAGDDIKIFINGTEFETDVKPAIINDRTLVPMRAIFEVLGADVQWNDEKKQVTGTKNEFNITLTIDSDEATINGKTEKLDVPAMLIQDRTMVPLRVIANALNTDVDWDGETRTILINDKNNSDEILTQAKEYSNEETIVFLGDSITQGGTYSKYIVHYLTTRFPNTKIKYANAGISGTSTPDVKEGGRLDWDVLADNPDKVFVLFGINDINISLYGENASDITQEKQTYINSCIQKIEQVAKKIKSEKTEVILATPPLYDEGDMGADEVKNTRKGANEALRRIGEGIKQISEEYEIKYADLWQLMNDVTDKTRAEKGKGVVLSGFDAIHPIAEGHFVMAYSYIRDLGWNATVAAVDINTEKKEIEAENAQVQLISCNSEKVEYSYFPNALPLAVDNVYRSVKENICEIDPGTVNRETIKVSGLDAGEYEITANGKKLLECSSDELAKGVNIAECENNPGQETAKRSLKYLEKGMSQVKYMRAILNATDGRSIKQYYKTEFGGNYQQLLIARNENSNDADIKKALKYAEYEQDMNEYIDECQQCAVPARYTVRIEKK